MHDAADLFTEHDGNACVSTDYTDLNTSGSVGIGKKVHLTTDKNLDYSILYI